MSSTDDELFENGLQSLMGLSRPDAPASPPPAHEPLADAEPRAEPAPPRSPVAPRASRNTALETPAPAAGDGEPMGYVGNGVVRTTTGLRRRVTTTLSAGVAEVLKAAAAVGDDNGSAISQILESLAVQAGYYPGGPKDPIQRDR